MARYENWVPPPPQEAISEEEYQRALGEPIIVRGIRQDE